MPQCAIEAFVIFILPRTDQVDIGRFNMDRKQPCLQYTGLYLLPLSLLRYFGFPYRTKLPLKISNNEKSTETVHEL